MTRSTEREVVPDVARGLALLLIAVANSMLHLHGRHYGVRQHLSHQEGLDQWVTLVSVATVEGRIYPLFGFLLGYGMVLAAHGKPREEYRARLRGRGLALMAFGAAHAVLLFSGDVLGLYGLLTILLLPALTMSTRRLYGLAALLLVLLPLPQAVSYATVGPTKQRSVLWSIGIEDPWLALLWRGPEWVMTTVGMSSVAPAVLLGIWWCRRSREPGRSREDGPALARIASIGIGIGVLGGLPAALAAAGLWELTDGLVATTILYLHTWSGVFAGIGCAAAIAWWCQRPQFRLTRGVRVLQTVGERSLTCYLLQSLVMAPVMAAWALGLGGHTGAAGAALVGACVYAGTVVVAVWLGARDQHPGETAVRRLATRWAPPVRTPASSHSRQEQT